MTGPQMRFLSGVCAATVFATVVTMHGQSSVRTRVIEENLTTPVPLFICGVPGMVMRIAESAKIPAGIESIPDCQRLDPPPPPRDRAEIITFLGMTVADALDRLMMLDPRYLWVESEGVIVVRPIEAWNDHDHFLNATISNYGFTDQNVTGASITISNAIRNLPAVPPSIETPGATPQTNLHFSVAKRTTSILEAMNDVVRAHGSLYWTIGYCQPLRRVEYASFMLYTFDHGGFGRLPDPVRGKDGKMDSVCPDPIRRAR